MMAQRKNIAVPGNIFLFRVDMVLLRKIGILKSSSFGLKKLLEFLKIKISEIQLKHL